MAHLKTEYPFGLGKDRRELSYHQSPAWMKFIARYRKYENVPKGEKSGRAVLKEWMVKKIRELPQLTRERSEFYGRLFGVNPSYLYQIRARKKWKHI